MRPLWRQARTGRCVTFTLSLRTKNGLYQDLTPHVRRLRMYDDWDRTPNFHVTQWCLDSDITILLGGLSDLTIEALIHNPVYLRVTYPPGDPRFFLSVGITIHEEIDRWNNERLDRQWEIKARLVRGPDI